MPCAYSSPSSSSSTFAGVELLVVMAVDDHHRRAAAGGQAFFFALEVDAAVGGGFAQLAAELLLRVRDQVFGAVEPAADVGAEGDVVAADLLGLEHRVEAGDLVGPHRRQVQVLGHGGDQFVAEPAAVLFLRGMQALQHGRALAVRRELGQPVVDVRARLVRISATMRVDIARASKLPVAPSSVDLTEHDVVGADHRHHVGQHVALHDRRPSTTGARSPARAACTRNGLLAPSETR